MARRLSCLPGLILVGFLILSLAGCSATSSPAPEQPSAAASATPAIPISEARAVKIVITEFVLDPPELGIRVGATVTWVNTDAARHTISADYGEFESGSLRFGDTFSYTFTTPGEYRYSCKVHNDLEGRLVVAP